MTTLAQTSYADSPSLLKPDFVLFLTGIFVYRAGWFMSLPFMAIYLSHVLKAGPIAIGLVLGVGPLIACVTGFLGSGLTDRFGAKTIILSSACGSALMFFLLCTSNNLIFYGVINLFIAVFRSFLETACQVYIADSLPEEQRSRGLNLRYIVINISAGIGPLIGAKMILLSAQTLFLSTGLIYFITFIGFCFTLKSCSINNLNQTDFLSGLRTSIAVLLRDKIAIAVFLMEFFICFTFAQTEITLPQVMVIRGIPHYVHLFSWLLVINAVMIITLQLPLERLINKYPLIKTIYLSAALFFIAFITFAFAHQGLTYLIATILFTLAEITSVTLGNIIIAQIAPPEMKGIYFGLITLSMLGFSASSLTGGVVLHYFGATLLFSGVAVLGIICFALLFALPKKTLHFKN